MKKRIGMALGVVLALGIGYASGIGFYAEKFSPNTSIGSIDISHLTMDQAKEKIASEISQEFVTLVENGEEIGKVSLGDLDYQWRLDSLLDATYQSQDPSQWIVGFFQGTKLKRVFAEQATIDPQAAQEALAEIGIENDERQEATNAEIIYDENLGYRVQEGKKGKQIDFEALGHALIASIEDGSHQVALEKVYADPEITAASEEIQRLMAYLNGILETEITLLIAGEEITIPKELIEEWVYFDSNNHVVIDEEQVRAYLEELDAKYSTAGKERVFQSTLQGEVIVPPGILGWNIDIDQEIANITQDLQEGQNVKRKAAFTGIGTFLGEKDDFGSTYIEVDLTNQMMYLYVDGEIITATNIVSGQLGAQTVPGANAVNEMLRDTDLVGFNPIIKKEYKVPVNYWIRFDNNAQGIHDASWQWAYGGDHYLYNGSLGCINTPLDQVALIYEYVEYGTPVMVFE